VRTIVDIVTLVLCETVNCAFNQQLHDCDTLDKLRLCRQTVGVMSFSYSQELTVSRLSFCCSIGST